MTIDCLRAHLSTVFDYWQVVDGWLELDSKSIWGSWFVCYKSTDMDIIRRSFIDAIRSVVAWPVVYRMKARNDTTAAGTTRSCQMGRDGQHIQKGKEKLNIKNIKRWKERNVPMPLEWVNVVKRTTTERVGTQLNHKVFDQVKERRTAKWNRTVIGSLGILHVSHRSVLSD